MTTDIPDFSFVLSILAAQRDALHEQLHDSTTRPQALPLKLEIDTAIRILKQAKLLGLSGKEQTWELPECLTTTPSSEFRILEDHETEHRQHWSEVIVDGAPLRLMPHDLVLRRRI